MEKEELTTRQLLRYAEENGYNSVKFFNAKNCFTGRFLDAYFEFVELPLLGDGFTRMDVIEETFGHDLKFNVIDEEEFKTFTRMSFILRRQSVPEKYAEDL